MPVCLPNSFGSVAWFGCRFDLICWLGCTLLASICLRFDCWFDLLCFICSVKFLILLYSLTRCQFPCQIHLVRLLGLVAGLIYFVGSVARFWRAFVYGLVASLI